MCEEMLDTRTPLRLHPVERSRPGLLPFFGAVSTLMRRRPLSILAGLMLAADAAFIAIQVATDVTDYGFNGSYRLALETEMGVPQFYGWAIAGATAYLLMLAWRRDRSPIAAYWAVVFTYIGLDDSLRFHERLGTIFAERFDLQPIGSLRGQDVGEFIGYLVIMGTAFTILVISERRDRGAFPTMLSQLMAPLVALFLMFAVVIDTAQGLLPEWSNIAVEDGGELVMLTFTFLAAIVWSLKSTELDELAR